MECVNELGLAMGNAHVKIWYVLDLVDDEYASQMLVI